MQPQGSHPKPSIRRPTNGRVVLSDDEDEQSPVQGPSVPAPAGPSQPRNAPPAVREAGPSTEAGRARHAGDPNQPHRRLNTQVLRLAVEAHLAPSQARTVPQKRKEPATAAAAAGALSTNGTTAGDGPTAIPDDEHRAAKRVRQSPPVPTPHAPTSAEALAAAFAAKTQSAASAPAVVTTTVTNSIAKSLPAIPPDVPPADDRPPPPPPLMPFKRPKPSPTPSTDSTPVNGSVKRKRAISFGPGDEASTKDQPAPSPLPQKKKIKSLDAILAESASRTKDVSSTPRSHPPTPGSGSANPHGPSASSHPMTATNVAESKQYPGPPKKVHSTPSHAEPSLAASRLDEKQKASAVPIPQPRHRDHVNAEKDAQFRQPTPKAVPRPEKAKGKDTSGDVPVPQRSRPAVADASREDKGKARAKVEGNSGKSRAMNQDRQPEDRTKPRAPPELDTAQSAPPKKKKLLPISSILTQVEERKQKEQTIILPTEPQSRQSGDALPGPSSKLAEHHPPERPTKLSSSVVVPETTRTRPAPTTASATRPSPAESAAPPPPPPKKKTKLLPVSSIVKQSEQRQQASGTALVAPRPAQDAAKLAAPESSSSLNRPLPRQPELLNAPHLTNNLRTPPAPAQASLPVPGVDESPRLLLAKKRASTELSHMNTIGPGPPQHESKLNALLMLADTAVMAPALPKLKQERFSSESRRESSSDTTLSARERALQTAQSELAHTEGEVNRLERKAPRRKLSELLEDADDYPQVEDNSQSRDNAAIVTDAPKHNRAATPQPLLGLLGLGAYGSSPEPEDQEDEPPSPIRLASPSVEIGQSRVSDTRKQSSPSAAVNSEAPSTDLPLKPHSSLLDPGSPPSVVQSTSHELHRAPSPPPPPSQPPPSRARPEQRRVSSRMVIQSPDSGADGYSSPHSPPPQSASPERPRKRSRSSSPAWPAEPASEAPAPEPAAQETTAPAPAKKKYGSFKKIKQPSLDAQVAQAKEPEEEKAPAPPPKRVPAHLPPKPAGLPPKPAAAAAAAPTPFGRQLPPEHSSRDLDPTFVISSVLGKPKRDSGITPEQRREWDQRKAADRAAREAEYAAQGPPLRMQKQMQTILQFEDKFKAKRTNVAPNIVAAAFKQRWEKTHGPWMPPVPGRRPQQESGPPPGAHGRPLPATPNDRANAKSSLQPPQPAMWRPLNGGAR